MNYAKIYGDLIERAKDRVLEGYSERHHVIARCMGGTDDPDNLVRLTAEEHFVAHQLLAKMHPEIRGLTFALLAMTMGRSDTRPTNKAFGWMRRRIAAAISQSKTGVERPPGTGDKISAALKGRKATEESKARQSATMKGRVKTDSHQAAITAALQGRAGTMTGKTHSDETKAKMRAAATGRKMSPEAVAKMVNNKTPEQRRAGAMKAWETKRARQATGS